MIYDYFRVTGAHDKVLDYADLFSVTLHNDNIQECDTRWDEVLSGESAQLKTVLELYDMEIHQKISMPNYQKLMTRNSDCEILTPETRSLRQEQWSRAAGE